MLRTDEIFCLFHFLCLHLAFSFAQRLNGTSLNGEQPARVGTLSLKLPKLKLLTIPKSTSSMSTTTTTTTAQQQLLLSKQRQQQQQSKATADSNLNNNNNNNTNKNNNSGRSETAAVSGSITKTFSLKRNSPTISSSHHRSFQYESFHVFDWHDYLIVSSGCCRFFF